MNQKNRRSGATASEAVGWAMAGEATSTTREQLGYLLEQPQILKQLQSRFAHATPAQQQGHYFEWMHELTFNLEAVRHGSAHRLQVTEWLGRPHDPADLQLVNASGELLAEAQAKVLSGVANRLSSHDGLAAPKYAGMDLLIPSDHVAETESVLGRRLSMPEGPLHERYRDVLDRVTDHVESGEISSAPVSTEELHRVAADPNAFLSRLVRDNELRQALTGLIAAGGTAVVVSLAVDIAQHRIRQGSLHDVDWADAALRATRIGAAAAAVVAAGTLASTQAQAALAAGSEGLITSAIAGGDVAFAMARGAMTVAGAAHGFVTGRLTAPEAATASIEGVGRTASVWACAAVGQAIVPVPVIGAMIGGVVGQYGATMFVQGLQVALLARDSSAEWDRAYELLLTETDDVVRQCEEEQLQLALLAKEYDTGFTRHVVPALQNLRMGFLKGDPDRALKDLADLTVLYHGTPQFSSLAEFEAFMHDPASTLTLNLGSKNGRFD